MIVSGSAIMSEDPRSVINLLRNVCSEADQKRSLDQCNHKEPTVSSYEISFLLENKNIDYKSYHSSDSAAFLGNYAFQ